MRKYNIIINVLFWTLIIAVALAAVWSYIKYADNIKKIIAGKVQTEEEKVIIKKEPVIISKTETKTIEWYYFVATAYSANDATQGTDNKTATGKEVYEGIIAVDPKIIPLGTTVEIKDLGKFIAEDTGGKIKGNRVDIYFNSKAEAKAFGKKNIWLRIIEEKNEIAGDFSKKN
ncbi:MAG: 3D domain-containing protein [Actinomycetota bacterium]|nr:3D domain-containing protein [Actinomycetota bacterium]